MTMDNDALPGQFDDVEETGSFVEEGWNILKLARLEQAESEFGPSIRWVFYVAPISAPTAPQRMQDGSLYEWYGYSATGLKVKTKSYTWASAFLGRSPAVGESGAAISKAIIGQKARAFLGPNPSPRSKGGTTILKIEPYQAPAQQRPAVAAPAQPAPAAPVPVPTEARSAAEFFGEEAAAF